MVIYEQVLSYEEHAVLLTLCKEKELALKAAAAKKEVPVNSINVPNADNAFEILQNPKCVEAARDSVCLEVSNKFKQCDNNSNLRLFFSSSDKSKPLFSKISDENSSCVLP